MSIPDEKLLQRIGEAPKTASEIAHDAARNRVLQQFADDVADGVMMELERRFQPMVSFISAGAAATGALLLAEFAIPSLSTAATIGDKSNAELFSGPGAVLFVGGVLMFARSVAFEVANRQAKPKPPKSVPAPVAEVLQLIPGQSK